MMTIDRNSSAIQRTKSGLLAGVLSASLLLSPAVFAQDSTPASSAPVASPAASPVAETISVTNLMTAQIDQLPQAPFTVRLLYITLQPGAITPMHSHHGPEIDMVESGEVTIRSKGDAPVTRADGTEETSSGEEMVLTDGDMVHFPAEIGMFFENSGSTPAVMLSAVIIPVGPDYVNERITWAEGEPNLEGVSYEKLGDGLVQELPEQAAGWTVNSVVLPAGVEMPALAGVSMITPTEGNLSFKIDAGQVQVTRADSNMLQPNAVLGSSFSLGDGDAAFFPSGANATPRSDEETSLTLLMMDIVPVDGVVANPAQLTFAAGDGTVAGDASQTSVGGIVTTNTDGVNMRDQASVDGEIVDQIDEGIELEVLDGPVEADDYTWYNVRVNQDGGSEGWMVAEFLDGLDAVPTAESTPAASDGTSTSPSEFEIGTEVVTIEEGVRLRPEASTGSEAIDALPMDSVLTVTGATEQADDYTWLPVETEDGLVGYVVIEFVKTAP